MITVCLNHSSILRSACAKGKKVLMGWHGEFKIHVKFNYSQKLVIRELLDSGDTESFRKFLEKK